MLAYKERNDVIQDSTLSLSKVDEYKKDNKKDNIKEANLDHVRLDERQLELARVIINNYGKETPDHSRMSRVWQKFKNDFVYNENRVEGLEMTKDRVKEIVNDLRLNKQDSKYYNVEVELQVFEEIIGLYKSREKSENKATNSYSKLDILQDSFKDYKNELILSSNKKNASANIEDTIKYLKDELAVVIDMEEFERSIGLSKKKGNSQKQQELNEKIKKLIAVKEIEDNFNTYKANNKNIDVDGFVNRIKEEVREIEEIIQITGHSSVYDYILDENAKDISAFSIVELHRRLYQFSPGSEFGGKFKNTNNYIEGAKIETVDYNQVFERLNALDDEVQALLKEKDNLTNMEFIDRAAKIHYEIVIIHPFSDGNGRVSRAFLNWLFKEKGLPPVYIKSDKKGYYFKALEKAYLLGKSNGPDKKNFEDLNQVFYRSVLQSLLQLNNLI